MSRVEHIGRAVLHLGDCRDWLGKLGRVDAVVTDPPYGIGMDGGKIGKAEYEQLDWDTEAADLTELLSLNLPPPRRCADIRGRQSSQR